MSTQRDTLNSTLLEIAEEYGGNLTIRQAYYQVVARGLGESSHQQYKRCVDAISQLRLSGEMPFDWIVDRTRTAKPSDACIDNTNVEDALETAASDIRSAPEQNVWRSRWWAQRKYVTVGVEKEALAGVFEKTCEGLGVGLFVFRGYASLSSIYELTTHIAKANDASQLEDNTPLESAVLLYFGDHDPDGWMIPRAATDKIEPIAEVAHLELPPVELKRIALTMAQIEQYNPPPFEAKISSARYAGYVKEHGTNKAWELDALRPDVLQELIRQAILKEFDHAVYQENRALVYERRAEMREQMREPGWIDSVFVE